MFDIYEAVTNKIMEQLESGVIPWHKPWKGGMKYAVSHTTGKPYSLINQFLLDEPGEYITLMQCNALGGKVKKGSKAKMIVFWKMYDKQATDSNGNTIYDDNGIIKMKTVPVLRYFNVFNINDCEGIKPQYGEELPTFPADPCKAAENIFSNYLSRTGCQFENHYQDGAYYSPTLDLIVLPKIEQFADTAEYYSTLFHETTHSTGHSSRLNRFEPNAKAAAFGSESYSREELIAEIGAATILHELGIDTAASFQNSAAYIQSWLKALRNDKRMIITASAKAEKAVALILNQ